MSKKSVEIHIGTTEAMGRRFVRAWKRAERGLSAEQVEHVTFLDLESLLSTLTPRRLALLKESHRRGPESVRSLAKALGRDYKNVHQDVAELLEIGLLVRTASGQIRAPWKSISASLDLAA